MRPRVRSPARSQEPGARSPARSQSPRARSQSPQTDAPEPFDPNPDSDDEPEDLADDGLPHWTPANPAAFTWGKLDSTSFISLIEEVYEKVVYWRKNLFLLPRGPHGKAFLGGDKAKPIRSWAIAGPMERIAFKALAVIDHLLLQKPHHTSTSKDHLRYLEKRLDGGNPVK